jgi:hypothetical protein
MSMKTPHVYEDTMCMRPPWPRAVKRLPFWDLLPGRSRKLRKLYRRRKKKLGTNRHNAKPEDKSGHFVHSYLRIRAL